MTTQAMNSRERMLAAIEHRPVDRIPTDIWMTPEIQSRLEARFGSWNAAREALHIDGTHGVNAEYVGPALPVLPPGESVNYWGIRYRNVDYGSGEYAEMSFHPLAEARTIDDLEKYTWPRVEWFDYSRMRDRAKALQPERVLGCGYMAPFYFHNLLRGLEQSLIDPLEDPKFTHHLVGRISDFFFEHHERMFQACEGLLDTAQVTDDLGTQHGPMISLEIYREFYKPHHARFARLCHDFGIRVFHHDDGAVRDFLPDLLEVGIDILNPIQWRCPGMDPEGLKRDYGGRLCFHGAIDNQETLPHGTTEDVRAEVRRMIDTLASDGTGYILAPCHNIQPVTPTENIIAMYDEAWRYGQIG